MTRQTFNTADLLRLEVRVKPTTPHNLVANPDGALGAWGWVTPGASYMRKQSGANALEHVDSVGGAVFHTEPMAVTTGQYAAAYFTIPAGTAVPSVYVRIEWLRADLTVISATSVLGPYSAIGGPGYSVPPTVAPALARFFRIRFDQTAAGTFRLTTVRAAVGPSAASLATVRVNLVPNPSFGVDLIRWTAGPVTTMARTTATGHVGVGSMSLTRAGSGPGVVGAYTEVAVTAGLDYTFQARFKVTTTGVGAGGRLAISWLDSGGVQIGATHTYISGGTTSNSVFDLYSTTATAPSGAVTARITPHHSVPGPGAPVYVDAVAFTAGPDTPAYWDGASTAAGTVAYTWNGTAHNSTSNRSDTTLASLLPAEWRNILGTTHTIKTARESLNLGTLEAELLDANLDPATSSTLRPGGAARLLASRLGVWEPIFVGEIDRLRVTYDDKTRPRPPRVSMTVLDHTRKLASARRPNGVAAVASLPHIVEGAGVPWEIDGNTGHLATAPASVSVNENATALDQIALTRDSTLSHAWVDRRGVLVAMTTSGMPTRTFDEYTYSDLGIAFSSEECMNAVIIESLVLIDGKTETVTHGPYENAESIAQWGRRERRFTVHGADMWTIWALADAILMRNATPQVTVSSVAVPLTSQTLVDDFATTDLGELVYAINNNKGIDTTLRVTSVGHTIESGNPERWMVNVGFTTEGSVAAPTTSPPVQPTSGMEDTSWTALPLLNGWANYGSGFQVAQYCRRNGIVHLRGLIQGTSRTSDHIFTLPAGFRHQGTQLWVGSSDSAGGVTRMDGDYLGQFTKSTGGWGFISLAQISYPAEA